MRLRSFLHKGLKWHYLEDNARGIDAAAAGKLPANPTFLQDMDDLDELRSFPAWKAHTLSGNRQGTWALHVMRNYRRTFRVEDGEIVDVNYEDYH